MNKLLRISVGALCLALFWGPSASSKDRPLRINGSTTVNPVASEAAETLSQKWESPIFVDIQGGSSGGITSIVDKIADIGMISMPLSIEIRNRYPAIDFVVTPIGVDAIALVVSRDVFDGGVEALTKEQIQNIYEKKIANWKEVGGPDIPIFFYNKEPGRGTWEVFAKWIYGKTKSAPPVSHAEVGGNEEARTKVATTKGSITQLSVSWATISDSLAPLGIKLPDGSIVFPTPQNIQKGKYPLVRPLNFITHKKPTGLQKEFIDFVLSPKGQELVEKHGYLPLAQLEGK